MLTTKKLNTIEGLSAGNTATLRLPIGLTYHEILLQGNADLNVATDIDEIRVVANGKPIQTIKGSAQINEFNIFDGKATAATDNLLVISFERYGLLTRLARIQTVLGTGADFHAENNPFPITTLSLEIDIAATAGASLGLTAKARQSAATPTGAVLKKRQFSYSPAGAGVFEISDLPKGDLINRIWFKGAKIDGLVVERDSYVLFERDEAENDRIQSDGVRTTIAGYFIFDPTEEGYGSEGLATRYPNGNRVSDLRFKLDMSGAEQVDVVVEYIGALGN